MSGLNEESEEGPEITALREVLKKAKTLTEQQAFDAAAKELTLGYFDAVRILDRDMMREFNQALLINGRASAAQREKSGGRMKKTNGFASSFHTLGPAIHTRSMP